MLMIFWYLSAIVNVAKRLYDQGYGKECDLVLEFAKSLFPQESSSCGSIWKSTQIHIEFMRALHQTDWTTAEHYIEASLGMVWNKMSFTKNFCSQAF